MSGWVDLRSDTVTRPTPEMRAAMASAEVGDDEPVSPGPERDALRGLGKELHEADRAGSRLRVRVEAALHVDDGGEERRVEVVVRGVAAEDVLVLERVARAEVEVGLLLDDPCRRAGDDENRQGEKGQQAHRGGATKPLEEPK